MNSKQKGGAFERQICKALSKWVTDGAKEDVFWRSAMSGGRATVQGRKGVSVRQAGDITAVAPEGHSFTDEWFVECKNIKDMKLSPFLLSRSGLLHKFWKKARAEAQKYNRQPMLIVRSRGPVWVFVLQGGMDPYTVPILTSCTQQCDVCLFDDMVKAAY